MSEPPTAYISHQCTGRARFKFAAHPDDRAYFEALAQGLLNGPGVFEVQANPMTHSILVRYEGALDDILAFVESKGLFTLLDRPPTPPSRPRGSSEEFDLNTLLALVFLGLGIMQVFRGQIFGPAFSLFGLALQLGQSGQRRRQEEEPFEAE